MKRILRVPAMSALVLLASACSGGGAGGGGVGPISPAPGPSPGGSPTPSPSPSPSPTNSSLADLQVSETFTSNASQAAARYDDSGTGSGTASTSNLTVSYDAASRSYTIANGARSQTFAQSNVIQNTPTATVYRRTSGAVTDTLTMTRPGTSGSLTYQYVGGGFWERAISGASAVDGSVDAFTYGVETPDTALARTGTAGFAVDLLGVLSSRSEGEPNAMRGTGSLIVDFASGRIDTTGRFDLSRPSTGSSGYGGAWSGRGQLSSSSNLFSGEFTILSFRQMTGSFDGRFYGPAAQEVGAAFWARAADGDVAAGALLGRRDSSVVSGKKLSEIDSDTAFVSRSAFTSYELGAGGIPRVNEQLRYTGGAGSTAWVDYNAAAANYTVRVQRIEVGGSSSATYDSFSVGAGDQLATQNDARFTLYRKTLADGTVADIKLYRPVGTNTELALSYLSFASIEARSPAGGDGLTTVRNSYVPFGYATPQNQIPIVGTASYNGVLYGNGIEYAFAYAPGGTNLYNLTGTARFELDFGSNRGTMRLSPVGTDVATGATKSFGNFDFALSRFGSDLRGSVGGGIVISDFNGLFYGPRAEEVGGVFWMRYQNPEATRWTELTGIAIGKQN